MIKGLTQVLLFTALTTVLLAACSQPDFSPMSGGISGQVPRYRIAAVTAIGADNQEFRATPRDTGTSGLTSYTIESLPPGTYTLKFVPKACYAAAATQSVVVTEATTSTAAIPTTTAPGGHGSFAEDFPFQIPFGCMQGTMQGSTLTLDMRSENEFSTVQLTLTGPVTPGTYSLSAGSPGYAGVVSHRAITRQPPASSSPFMQWSTASASGRGSITITAVEANPRRVSGTYNLRADPVTGATGQLHAWGTFTDVLY